MNFLITAGPTREYIDPIRFISNASSGRQGIAIAEQAKKRGHSVVLIMGPCAVGAPKEIPIVSITTAEEMLKSVLQYKDWMDVFIMNAAVGDWKVVGKAKNKIKKSGGKLNLKLALNPDILARVGKLKKQKKTKKNPILVGFSVDTRDYVSDAEDKLKNKGLDIIVANPLESLNSIATESVIIDRAGTTMKLPLMSKKDLAKRLIRIIEHTPANISV